MPSRWWWWTRLALVTATSVVAVLLILAGAVRFLDQAQREHDRVECLRSQVEAQAQGNATMAAAVLDPQASVAQRTAAVATWRDAQAQVARQIGRC